MNKYFGDHRPSPEQIVKSQLKMLVVIINRGDGEKTTKFLREKHFHFQVKCLGQGTSGSDILDLLGFGSVDKTIVLSVMPHFRSSSVISELSEELKLEKAGKGIAFTIPLSGIVLPPHLAAGMEHVGEKWSEHMEGEVDKMNENLTHDVIIAVINKGASEELMEVAKAAGATGGTIINARNTGAEHMVNFFGISLQSEKEIVAILTARETKRSIMDAINNVCGIKTDAHGIILSLPVDSVIGLSGV